MKRLLTYGLLLLTILASHFVVSACQDDSDKTTIIMTFTTRVENPRLDETTGESAEVPKEQMKELRIIMAREDGTVIVNEIDPSVKNNPYLFSIDVPMMTYTERFQFIVIANESTLVSSDGNAINLSDVQNIDVLKNCVIGQNGFSLGELQYIPQTIYWTQDITYGETTNIQKELLFVVGKITVEFENQTEEPQSLSDIHIKGIIPNAQGYLLAQASNDFVGMQHDASAMQDADIIFNPVTDLSVDGSSPIQHYYTYPVGSYGVASSTLSFTQSEKTYEQPTLFATWNGKEYDLPITEVRDEESNVVHKFTSLARNERLKIVITLTPAGDITVNYTIAAWEDTPTNIGDKAPITPGNGYNTENWGASNDIEIGGDEDDPWSNLGGDIIASGKDIFANWNNVTGLEDNSYLKIPLDEKYLVVGNKIAVEFKTTRTNNPNQSEVIFRTDHGTQLFGPFTYDNTKNYVISMTFDAYSVQKIKDEAGLVLEADSENNIDILRFAIVQPD